MTGWSVIVGGRDGCSWGWLFSGRAVIVELRGVVIIDEAVNIRGVIL